MDSNNVLVAGGRRPATTLRDGWPVLIGLMLATLAVTVDNTITNVALPSIDRDLDASTSQLQWITNAYSLLFGGLLLTGGAVSDRLGRRRVLMWGLAAFGTASVLVVLVHSVPVLIGLRALTGACAAFLTPSTIALMYRSFEGPARAAAIGIVGAAGAFGFVLGPLLGGALLSAFAWQSVFLINVPMALIALIVARVAIPADAPPRPGRADVPGAVLSIAAMVGLVAALIAGPDDGWASASVVGPAVGALLAATAFVLWELHASHPMLDVRLLARRTVGGAAAVQTVFMISITGTLFLLTQLLQISWGYSPIEAGLRSAPIAIGVIGGGGALTFVARRLDSAWVVSLGLLLAAAATVTIAFAVPHADYWPIAAALLALGVGVRMCIPPSAIAILGGLPREAAGIGAALADASQEIGGALGVALLGSILNVVYRQDLPAGAPEAARASLEGAIDTGDGSLAHAARTAFASGAHTAFLVCAAVLVVAAVLARRTIPTDLDLAEQHPDAESSPTDLGHGGERRAAAT